MVAWPRLNRFWSFVENFLRGCLNYVLRVHGKSSRKISSFDKINFFLIIFSQGAKHKFGLLAQFFRRGCQNCILRVHMNNLRKKKIEKTKSFSDIELWASGFLSRKFQGLSKLLSECPLEHSEESKNFLKEKLSLIIWDIERKKLWLLSNFFGRVLKLRFMCPREHFEEKTFFWKKIYFCHPFWPLSGNFKAFGRKIFWRSFQTSVLGVHGNILRKIYFFWRNSESYQFWTLSGKLSAFCQKIFNGDLKLHSTCLNEHLRFWKLFPWIKITDVEI